MTPMLTFYELINPLSLKIPQEWRLNGALKPQELKKPDTEKEK